MVAVCRSVFPTALKGTEYSRLFAGGDFQHCVQLLLLLGGMNTRGF